LLAKTLAQVLDVPFSVSDATSFTQVWNIVVSRFDEIFIYTIRQDVSTFGFVSCYQLTIQKT
jgi:ATP-dependent protease Clp ATPase subunit